MSGRRCYGARCSRRYPVSPVAAGPTLFRMATCCGGPHPVGRPSRSGTTVYGQQQVVPPARHRLTGLASPATGLAWEGGEPCQRLSLAGSVRQQPSVPPHPLRHLFPTQGAAGCHFHPTQPVFFNTTTLAVDRR